MFRILMSFIFLFNITVSNAEEVTYGGIGETIDLYHTELLQLILDHVETKKYQVNRYDIEIPHMRAFEFLATKKDIDIVIGYATNERERRFRAIPLPIMKGVNGIRTSIIHKDNIAAFKGIKTLDEFKQFKPGLHHAWTDNKIFAANGIETVKGSSYEGLFHMLNQKRFDYYPLTIFEAVRELKKYKTINQLDLVIDPNVLIFYPVCFYFYVEKSNVNLAQDIVNGFEAIIANGRFDQVFDKYHGEVIVKLLKEKRTIIHLNNPLLPLGVPLERKELWIKD